MTSTRSIYDERFEHLYGEKVIHISRQNRQSLSTGYRPDHLGHFHFCIKLLDHREENGITLTLYQFVRLMKDLRDALFTEEEIEILDEADARLQFKFHEINVPSVLIEVDASQTVPNLFQLKLRNNKSDPYRHIVFDRKTLQKIVGLEAEIINTIETLEDKSCNYMFNHFISLCVEQLESSQTVLSNEQMYEDIKEMKKTPYQSEIFLKFWPLISTIVARKVRGKLMGNMNKTTPNTG